MFSPAQYRRWYGLLDRRAPLGYRDCGRSCGRICCTEYEEGVGIYLFPGEESLYASKELWFHIERSTCAEEDIYPYDESPIDVFICGGRCPRHMRPLACRLFPLTPILRSDGVFTLGYPIGAYPICPLTQANPGSLHRGFRRAVRSVYGEILTDPILFGRYLDETLRLREETKDKWFLMMRENTHL
jgi:hypothetical protein